MPQKMKKFRVDIQFTTELIYDVEATTEEAAMVKARQMYDLGGDLHVHHEIFDSYVTNVEQV